jgi:hypothetical protein
VWAVVQATTADDRKIFLVVGGLVAVALALSLLTIRYWRITRPVPVGDLDAHRGPTAAPAPDADRRGSTIDLDALDDDDIFVHTAPVPTVAPTPEPAAAAPEPAPGGAAGQDHVGADDDWRSRATGEHPIVEPRSGPGIVRPSRDQRAAALQAARPAD